MINPVGSGAFEGALNREWIFNIALVYNHVTEKMFNRASIAAPAFESVNFETVQAQQIIGKKAPDRPGDARNENAHKAPILTD
jgi:hypothetical protein